MRIISGDFKGKKILQPKDKLTRPLKDLTKESIFNIINHSNLININLKNSNILDLFWHVRIRSNWSLSLFHNNKKLYNNLILI